MGFKRNKPVYVLQFVGEYEGLEVRAKGASVGQLMKLLDLASIGTGKRVAAEDVKEIDALFALFSSRLLAWNLENEDGTPVPLTLEGLKDQDIDFAMAMVMAWLDAVIGVSAPLERKSEGGAPYPEASIPMDVS